MLHTLQDITLEGLKIGGEKTTTYFELAEIRGLGFANC